MTDEEHLESILHKENEHLEKKKAEFSFDFDKLMEYVSAFSNEGGGFLILGIDNEDNVIGTAAFADLEKTKHLVLSNGSVSRQVRVEILELHPRGKRILVFKVPSRPTGEAISFKGAYLMRSGESLVPMDGTTLKGIINEYEEDFSAQPCHDVGMGSLDPEAIKRLRDLWFRKSGNSDILTLTDEQVLVDLGLYRDGKMTFAAIILAGNKDTLDHYLANAETIWEYRKNATIVEYQDRIDYREPFVLYFDKLWEKINTRNEVVHIQEGFLVRDVKALNDEVIREAILNAIGHRDYKNQGSVYVRQSPEQIVVESPGGFLSGINPENIIYTPSRPRNRLIVEVFQKIGFVERSGQGVDKIFRNTIAEGKGLPSYDGSAGHSVKLTLNAFIRDLEFVKYIEKVINQANLTLSVDDYITLENIRENRPIDTKAENIARLLSDGIIEKPSRGSGKYMLSKQYYSFLNKRGLYTRKKGLDKATNIELILAHLKNHSKGYADELMEALKDVKRSTLNNYLRELAREDKIELIGSKFVSRGPHRSYWQLKK